ncbi:acetyltransferase [Synechococcus sp. PCC 7502]|uniref:GNAT family N-acetyltransferase n=1 Tax=Synechococcus sp. PCC 7502 TaxID=1173263 RepID=UPI00029F9331|nr:GNAT family N-acetyltransferase [Synechococcus sp. PCC 7502]AFY72502.1 acetyltransferase [Synechococcus sp. PCC 7502]
MNVPFMIRLTTPDDISDVIALAEATGLFEPEQIESLAQMIHQYFNCKTESRDLWLTYYSDKPVGVAYVAPERMTEGTWNLYLIAVHPNHQKKGYGKTLLQHVEKTLGDRGERILLVETSGTEDFEYVRRFYRNNGFEEEARIREFYASGIDKIVFRKVLPKTKAM